RRRHTRFSRDWSSDVCSSDLLPDNHELAASARVALDVLPGVQTRGAVRVQRAPAVVLRVLLGVASTHAVGVDTVLEPHDGTNRWLIRLGLRLRDHLSQHAGDLDVSDISDIIEGAHLEETPAQDRKSTRLN